MGCASERALWMKACELLEQNGDQAAAFIQSVLQDLAERDRPDEMVVWFDIAELVFRMEPSSVRQSTMQ